MTTELKNSLFSKFHHTFDEDKQLRFFFAIAVNETPKYDGLLNVEVLRHNLLPPYNQKTDLSKQIPVEIMDFTVDNEKDYVYVSGIDTDLSPTENHYYTVTVITRIKNQIDIVRGTDKTNLHNSIPSSANITTHEYSLFKYEPGQKLSKKVKMTDAVGFVKTTKDQFEENSTIKEETVVFEKLIPPEETNSFIEYNDESAPRKSSGLNVNTVLMSHSTKPPEKQYVSILLTHQEDAINYEYLASYGNNITIENWKSLNMEEIKDKELVLVRGKYAEPYSNKYFFLGE
jgi:hypothetical protein